MLPGRLIPSRAVSSLEKLGLAGLLALATAVGLFTARDEPPTADEMITLLETAGHALPAWPSSPVPAEKAREIFRGTATPSEIVAELRATDVHPPLYFWLLEAWRRAFGGGLRTARLFSLLCSLGTLAFLYRLLRFQSPALAAAGAAACVLAPGLAAAFTGARPYALALLLVTAAAFFALRSSRDAAEAHGLVDGLAMAACCGLAFGTNYLALFPAAAILAGSAAARPSGRRGRALLFAAVAVAIAAASLPLLARQIGARPAQEAGFPGALPALRALARMAASVTFLPASPAGSAPRLLEILLATLLAVAAAALWRDRRKIDAGLWLLLAALAIAPALGLLALDVLFDKFLQASRYLVFAAPAIAAFLAYPAARPSRWRAAAAPVLAAFSIAAALRAHAHRAERFAFRDTARALVDSAASSQVVVLEETGRGMTGGLLYELDPRVSVAVLRERTGEEALLSAIREYDRISLFSSFNPATRRARETLVDRLTGAGGYDRIAYERVPRTYPYPAAVSRFRRRTP